MCLTATASREVAQTLVFTTSEWGLGREVQAIRTRPECPKDSLRELMWDSNPNYGFARDKTKQKPFLQKALSSQVTPGTLKEQKIERIPKENKPAAYRALPPQRQRDRWSTTRAERQGAAAISAPETASSSKLWEGSQFVNSSSWDPGWLTSARNVTAWDQLRRGDTQQHWGLCSHSAPRKPSSRGLGGE